jgi:ribonucleoside-diphosphate reductase beta chain
VLVGYPHFLTLARRAQWDADEVDLTADAAAWPWLHPAARDRLARLVAGFCVGEASVASELAPFGLATEHPVAADCFAAQEHDERRHARFFDRVACEVMGVPGGTPAGRIAAQRPLLAPAFLALFERRLAGLARDLARGDAGLGQAVGLYHMVLEGVVFTAGQRALLDALADRPELPGLRYGVERVLRDERWHIGFGSRCLQDAGLAQRDVDAVLGEGEAAAAAWAEVTGAGPTAHAIASLERRMRTVVGGYAAGGSGRSGVR